MAPFLLSQKIQKSLERALTVLGGGVYIRLTNDGGDAAGDEEVRFYVSRELDEIKRAA